MVRKALDPLTLAPLHQVLSELSISDWDALLVGDGSGTDWKNSCGFSAVLIDHYGNYRQAFHGALNTGTNQIAELMPYIHAMTWYASGPGKARLEDRLASWKPGGNYYNPDKLMDGSERPPGVKIHIITDNRNLANQGNYLAARKAYSWLWKTFDELSAMGYQFTWHWLPRMKLGLNRLVDCMSSKCRKEMEKIELPPDVSLYDFNPDFIVPEGQLDTATKSE